MTDVTYDTAVYDVTVRVTSTESGEPKAVVWGGKEGTEGKSYEIIFTNSVKEQAPEIAPTGKTAIYRNYPVKTGDVAPIAVLAAMSGISAGVLTAVERSEAEKRKLGNRGKEQVRSKCRSCSFSYGIIAVKNRKIRTKYTMKVSSCDFEQK